MRNHKRRHDFSDTPSDICICKLGAEDTDHFFLSCPFYVSHRLSLRTKVHAILSRNDLNVCLSSNLCLYGHESLSSNDNREILLASLEFIFNSNRFTH